MSKKKFKKILWVGGSILCIFGSIWAAPGGLETPREEYTRLLQKVIGGQKEGEAKSLNDCGTRIGGQAKLEICKHILNLLNVKEGKDFLALGKLRRVAPTQLSGETLSEWTRASAPKWDNGIKFWANYGKENGISTASHKPAPKVLVVLPAVSQKASVDKLGSSAQGAGPKGSRIPSLSSELASALEDSVVERTRSTSPFVVVYGVNEMGEEEV